MNAVVRSVSDGIFRHQLEGFDKYPRGRDERFLEVFNSCVVSVDHARAVVDAFRVNMPTLQDIIDTALNLRPRFEVTETDREKWEREYGPAQPFRVDPALLSTSGREIDRLWRDVLNFLRPRNFDGKGDIQRVDIGRCWQVAKACGYKMNSRQQREIERYEQIYPQSRDNLPTQSLLALPGPAITQADIERVKAERAGQETEGRWE